MIRTAIREAEGHEVPTGTLDITLYRDDLMALGPRPVVGETKLPPGGVEGMAVVLVDDVLYTGRTARAALNELMDWGRPPGSCSACWWTGATGSCPSSPTSWEETGSFGCWRTNGWTCWCRGWTESWRWC